MDTKVKLQLKQETSFQRTRWYSSGLAIMTFYGRQPKRGYKIVNSYFKYTYLNFNHDRITPGLEYDFEPIPLEKAYAFNPIPEGFTMQEQKQIIGIGCQMWGEWIPQVEDMYRMIYPYWATHAETGWTDNKRKNYNRFVRSMDYFLTRWIDKNYINSHNIGIKQHQ